MSYGGEPGDFGRERRILSGEDEVDTKGRRDSDPAMTTARRYDRGMTTPPTSFTLPADRSHLATEARDPLLAHLDTLNTADVLATMNQLDAQVPAVVASAIPVIARVVDAVVASFNHSPSGRLVYIGAGTSGRLGVLDASECPPTYNTDPSLVIGMIAGGDGALRKSSEGMEDDLIGAFTALNALRLTEHDVVVGIAAGGSTPYVRGGLVHAKALGCTTALLCCVTLTEEDKANVADHVIELPVGPELVSGSSRLKAGTATKLALNMITTAAMVKTGKTWGNLMVDVRATNDKLRDRAARIITQQTGLSRADAFDALAAAEGSTKIALVMVLKKLDKTQATELLNENGGQLRAILGEPR